MKFYKASMSGSLLNEIFSTGVWSGFDEQLEVFDGLPEGATLIQVRMTDNAPANLDMLWATDEPYNVPGAMDVWSWAATITPRITKTVR